MSIYANAPNNWVTNDIAFDQAQGNQELREKFLEIDAALKADKLNLVIAMGGVSDEQIDIDAECLKMFDTSEQIRAVSDINLTVDDTASGANGIDTGVVAANTWYSIWVIAKADLTVAGLLHAGGTGVIGDLTFPAGYTYARLVGWILTDATSDFLKGYWDDSWFYYDVAIEEFNGAGPAAYANVDFTSSMPPTANRVAISMEPNAGNNAGVVYWRRDGSAENSMKYGDMHSTYSKAGFAIINTNNSQIAEIKTGTVETLVVSTLGYENYV